MFIVPDVAIGAIAAALIGASAVFLSTVLTKEQKTSEFRQLWVDALRNDLAEYIAGVAEFMAFADDHYSKGQSEGEQFLLENHERLERFKASSVRIALRLNAKEHDTLLNMVDSLIGDLGSERTTETSTPSLTRDAEKKMIAESQRVLKKEWERVKAGELTFRLTKYVALGCIVLASTGGAITLYRESNQAAQPMTTHAASQASSQTQKSETQNPAPHR